MIHIEKLLYTTCLKGLNVKIKGFLYKPTQVIYSHFQRVLVNTMYRFTFNASKSTISTVIIN